ncbi:hypothetical protein GUITHDRAFT_100894 [Guillardia theta CCMP2712]|uniref:Uncharacterized protein n=1 Tax=Guillardia theta (strain CCMP2712) TaxID=905079 RepID=L1JY84_GUITC|nr:hypothetical protein GUITHDRAFT_100894 [Guillardia theta CCMP2712]EKX53185.1 hypothetical protein GUITHDRAFT_100894 [Guillardia theta CCMP2712]|eukprot:XP_005840165.1 hypothetical protein GUITHDRAFT_100894 [Guillardia theta CCMP2712]
MLRGLVMLNGGFLSGPHESIMGGGTPLCPYDSNGVCYSDGTGRDESCSRAAVLSIACMPLCLLRSALSLPYCECNTGKIPATRDTGNELEKVEPEDLLME